MPGDLLELAGLVFDLDLEAARWGWGHEGTVAGDG